MSLPAPRAENPQWEGTPRWLLAVPLVFLAVAASLYVYAIPLAAHALASIVPAGLTDRLSRETLAALDRDVFKPTEVAKERRDALDAAFRRLRRPEDSSGEYQLVFRKSEAIGANALALPSGTIVVTDGLMALARDDREVLGVLAHEAGHVEHRHGLRGVIQRSFVGLLMAWLAGDMSAIVAAAPSALLEASYSRDLEREADEYAIQVMTVNGIPLRHLAALLRRLDESSGREESRALSYLSSHPATGERLARLEPR